MKSCITLVLVVMMLSMIGGAFTMADTGEMVGRSNASEVWRALQRLQTTATVLHTVAHPDDENSSLLTWLSRAQGVRTGLYSTTRGEGGANLIGPELFDGLGIVRTEEYLASARYYGVDLFFSRAVDFGYSKRLDETLEKWDYQMLLEDMVRLIREYRPDVLISRFQGNRQDGHGHHQASGVVTLEAFRVAGDANRFPEHIAEGLQPWQPKKLYITRSRWRHREAETIETPILKIDTGEYNALLGVSYHQIARKGLSYQRSQGAGQTRAAKGTAVSELRLVDTTLPKTTTEKSLFDGIDTTIMGMAKLAALPELRADFTQLQQSVNAALDAFDARHPWTVMPHLTKGLKTTRHLIERIQSMEIEDAVREHLLFLLGNKAQEFMIGANTALGLSLEVLVQPESAEGTMFLSPQTFAVAIPGQKFSIAMRTVNPTPVVVEFVNASLQTPKGWGVHQVQAGQGESEKPLIPTNEAVSIGFEVEVPRHAAYTRPYWHRDSEYHDAVYTLDSPAFRFLPFAPPEVHGVLTYRVDGVDFTMMQPAQTVSINRPWGEKRRLLTVAPAISLSVSPRIGVIPIQHGEEEQHFTTTVEVLNNVKGEAKGVIALQLPEGWTALPENAPFAFTHEGASRTFTFRVSAQHVEAGKSYIIQAVGTYHGEEYTTSYQTIDYPDLEPRHLYRSATMTLHSVDVKLPKDLKVGYIMGVGDKVPEALQQIGIDVQLLDLEELRTGDLSQFDTILIGIRAYAVRRDLVAYNSRLLDYVHKGGNLIVQYQTPEFDAAPFGPYPYTMGRRPEEVSEEDAQVSILEPNNSIFHHPNRITAVDFDGWVEERGSKFLTDWHPNYQALLACNDREQEPQHGGFLYAQYGQGTYTYAAYAFYRQLPAGVEGAFRLFTNMISLGKASQTSR